MLVVLYCTQVAVLCCIAAVKGAQGLYVYDCYSATTQDMSSNREKFIDSNGLV